MGRKWWKKHKQKKQTAKEKPVSQKVQTIVAPPCHDGVIGVFTYDNVTFWGGKARDIVRYNDWSLMLTFSDRGNSWEDNDPAPFITANAAAKKLLSPELFLSPLHAPYIGLDWPDFGSPDLDRGWWERLLEDILRLEGDHVDVAMGCTGGHGRTGTALAIFHGLLFPNDPVCPVAAVRKNYCGKCVESRQQIKYITDITGVDVRSAPSWVPVTKNNQVDPHWWSQYEVGDRKDDKDTEVDDSDAQGSAHDTVAELEAMADRDLERLVQKELGIDRPSYVYRPVVNKAGDITGWEPDDEIGL